MLDFFAIFGLVFTIFGSVIVFSFILVPVLLDIAAALGWDATNTDFRAMADDLQALVDDTLLRIGIILPALVFVLLRERIARPFRSRFAFFAALGLAAPWVLLLIELLFWAMGLPKLPFSIAGPLGQGIALFSDSVDSSTLSGIFIFTLFATYMLGSLTLVPYILLHVLWRKRLGVFSRRSSRSSVSWKALGSGLKTLVRSSAPLVLLICSALVVSAMPVALFFAPPPFPFERWLLDLVVAQSWIPQAQLSMFVGLAFAVVWPLIFSVTLSLVLITLVRPSFRWLVFQIAVLSGLSFLLFVLLGGANSSAAMTVLVVGLTLSLWLPPVVFFILRAIRTFRHMFGLSYKALVRETARGQQSILLLRSFALDDVTVRWTGSWFSKFDLFGVGTVRLEEVVVSEGFVFAPVVAVANPAVTREPLGALREYLADDAWQPFVADKIASSCAILFVLGRGNFTGWETNEVLAAGALEKMVFVVPPDPAPALEYLQQNPDVLADGPRQELESEIKKGRVRCFVIRSGQPTVITNRFKSQLDYTLAIRLVLSRALAEQTRAV